MHGSAPAKEELRPNCEVIGRDREEAGDAKRIARIVFFSIRGCQTAAAADEAVA